AVVMSSDPQRGASADATDYRAASYFQDAMAGEAGHYFSFDAGTRGRAYFASYPIAGGNGSIIGAAGLEKTLAALEAELQHYDPAYFLVNPDGVVMLTNRPRLMLRNLWPPPVERRAALARQFGSLSDRPMLSQEISDGTWANFGGERDYVLRR